MTPINHTLNDIVRNKSGDILPFSYLNFIRVKDVIIFPMNLNTPVKLKKILKYYFLIKIYILLSPLPY